MSHVSSSSPNDLDIWEFVPFWLTECGHVICNVHLNADQSCCVCGSQQIQMMPLQKEVRVLPLAFLTRT
ncbi:hypothetical protein EDB86DRAFT_2944604 [Lactarius hatsudake]|nr:hypothetical protein EDB86DRAFT_2944604 [Lactarius hatsudake]